MKLTVSSNVQQLINFWLKNSYNSANFKVIELKLIVVIAESQP